MVTHHLAVTEVMLHYCFRLYSVKIAFMQLHVQHCTVAKLLVVMHVYTRDCFS